MKKPWLGHACGLAAALGVAALAAGCGDEDDAETKVAASDGTWTVPAMPYSAVPGKETDPNPINGTSLAGGAEVFTIGDSTKVKLSLTGLPASRQFGSHVHKQTCAEMLAGGHYQHNPFPEGGKPTDPAYANSMNEIWLDFMSDASGKGSSERIVAWKIDLSRAKAIVVHDMPTATGAENAGTAGAKLACINLKAQ